MSSIEQDKPCPSCALVGTFETSRSGAEDLIFCTECGFIDQDSKSNLVDSAGFGGAGEFYSDDCTVKLDRNGGVTHGKSKSTMRKKKTILDAVGQLGLPNTVKNAALDLYDKILPHLARQASTTLALSCLFVVVNREPEMHIPLRDFCRRLQCEIKAIANGKKWIHHHQFHEPHDPERMTDALITKRLHEIGIPIAYEKKLKKLMSLVKKGWVSAGRTDEMFLWPCLYVLSNSEAEGKWVAKRRFADGEAQNVTTFPKKLSKSKFFREYRVGQHMHETTFTKNSAQVSAFLLTLTNRVPWLTAKRRGTEAGLFQSIDWILDNDQFCNEMIEKGNDTSTELREFLPPIHMVIPDGTPPEPVEEVDPESIPRGEELTEEDIRDEDMHQYVRSSEEVAQIAELLETVKSDIDKSVDKKYSATS